MPQRGDFPQRLALPASPGALLKRAAGLVSAAPRIRHLEEPAESAERGMSIAVGDRVEHSEIVCKGTVEHVSNTHVRVRWDDGKVGLLYFNGPVIAQVKYLQKMQS